jgi:hypothetical protein
MKGRKNMVPATMAAEPPKLEKAAAHRMTIGGPSLAVIFIALCHPDAGCLPVRYRPQRSKYESVGAYSMLVSSRSGFDTALPSNSCEKARK